MVADRYRLRRLIGSGGAGRVYEATDPEGRTVAVKLLRADADLEWSVRDLFSRGAEVLRQLEHPLLPRVERFVQDEIGSLVLVREYFSGGSLHERITEGGWRLSVADLEALAERLLELLAYLHGRVPPVIHRDIKPRNLLFRRTDPRPGPDEPVLVDFDTVAAAADATGETIVVSAGYTAPEQLAGAATPASDLFSLGGTLLFVATHTEPEDFPRDADGRLRVGDRLDHLPDPLRSVLLRLVEPERRERFGRAEDALAALRAAPAPSLGERLRPFRSRWRALAAGGVALLAVATLLVTWTDAPEPDSTPVVPSASSTPTATVSATPTPIASVPAPPPVEASTLEATPPPRGPAAVSVAGRGRNVCAAFADGTVRCGERRESVSSWEPVDGVDDVVQVAASEHRCAVSLDGRLWCWGRNRLGETGSGSGRIDEPSPVLVPLEGAKQVVVGRNSTCALVEGGAVRCWGRGTFGVLGDPERSSSGTPLPVVGLPPVRHLAHGGSHVCAATVSGEVWCWGSGRAGALGHGARTHGSGPVRAADISDAVAVAAGRHHSCALHRRGGVSCWGTNARRELGDGTTEDRLTPTRLPLEGVREIAAGWVRTCARLESGDLLCWGPTRGRRASPGPERPEPASTPGPVRTFTMRGNRPCAGLVDGRVFCP